MMRKAAAKMRKGRRPSHDQEMRRPGRADGASWLIVGRATSVIALPFVRRRRSRRYLTVTPTTVGQPAVIAVEAAVICARVGSCVPLDSGSFAFAAGSRVLFAAMSS